jgi:hypothetical protein
MVWIMNNDKPITAEDIFLYWKRNTKDIGKARFTAIERIEQLDYLCELFKQHDVSYDDALSLKRQVVEFMVTKEGQKGNGKYKGWKENTEEDFKGTLLIYYNNEIGIVDQNKSKNITDTSAGIQQNQTYGDSNYMERDEIITAWSKDKFRCDWSESICLECHKICGPLWNMFCTEVLESDWAKTGIDVPEWAKFLFDSRLNLC